MKTPFKTLLSASLFCSFSILPAFAGLQAGWNFKTPPGAVLDSKAASVPVPTVLPANAGQGTIYLDGTKGSSAWNGHSGETSQLQAMGGTSLNGDGLPSGGKGTVSLALRQPAEAARKGADANGKSLVIEVPAKGPVVVSYAYRRSSDNTFQTVKWEVSGDGQQWTEVESVAHAGSAGEQWGTTQLKPVSAPAGAQTLYLRATFTGASPNPSSVRNFQITNFRIATE